MSDDVRADAREALAQWAKYGVAGTSDVEEVAPALVDRLLAELDRALATLQQVREWSEQRRHDGPPTDDLATVLLDGAAHQLLRVLGGGAR